MRFFVLPWLSLLFSCVGVARPLPSPASVIARTSYRVVIDCGSDGVIDGMGSAVAIGPATLLTAAHVVRACPAPGAATFVVVGADGPPRLTVADRVLRVDVARLRLVVGSAPLPAWALPAVGAPALGDELSFFPGAEAWKVGRVSAVTTDEIVIAAYAVPGNSGSGVFDAEGRLVGILWGARWANGEENFAVLTRVCHFAFLWV